MTRFRKAMGKPVGKPLNKRVKKVPASIAVATAYAAFYQVAPFVGIATGVIIALFVLSPFVVCSMAYVIVKYGEPSSHTFEEKFYDDLDHWRNRAS